MAGSERVSDIWATARTRGLLVGLVLDQWLPLAIAVGAGVIAAVVGLVPFVLVYRIVADALAGELTAQTLYWAAGISAIAIIGKWGLRATCSRAGHAAAYDALYDLRITVARMLAQQPLGAVQAIGTARMRKILYDDVEALELFLAHHLAEVTAAICTPLLVLIILGTIDWRLAVAASLPLVAAIVMQAVIFRGHGDTVRGYHDAQERVDARTVEYIRAMPTIRMFAQGERATASLQSAVDSYRRYVAAWAARWYLPGALFSVAVGAGFAATLAVGAWLLATGKISPASLVLAALLSDGFAHPAMKLLQFPEVFSRLKEGERRIMALIDVPPLAEPEKPSPPRGAEVRFSNVGFRYGTEATLHDVNFVAPEGKFTAIVGPSGAGKSTLLSLVARSWDVSSGSITIGGTDIRELGSEQVCGNIVLMQQSTILFDGSILDNVRMARPDASLEQVNVAVAASGLDLLAARLPEGLDTKIGDNGVRLSGGERQRVGLARTILRDSPVVLLDEPTSSADAETEATMQRGIVTALRGRTVIMVAHRLSTVRLADRIVVVKGGTILDQGTHSELLHRCQLYAAMWETAQQVSGWRIGSSSAAR